MRWGRPSVVVREITAREGSMAHRIEALVDGDLVFFESDEMQLSARSEAFGSAFLLPAAAGRRRLELEGAVDPSWLEGLDAWADLVRSWWGYRAKAPRSGRVEPDRAGPGEDVALCFSGGVDSFYALLHADPAPTHVVYVHGFDRALDDDALLPRVRGQLAAVASARGVTPVLVRTNLRTHPLFEAVNWERSHGGALAAIGHILTPRVGRLLVAATFSGPHAPPWGSHARLDPRLGRDALTIEHVGADLRRAERIRAIASDPLAQHHLRVCWESTGDTWNCSRCDKCLVTMLVLHEAGMLSSFRAFQVPEDLPAALDGVAKTYYPRTVRDLAAKTDDRRLRAALHALDARSGPHPAYDRGSS